jgi:hypothetical protein
VIGEPSRPYIGFFVVGDRRRAPVHLLAVARGAVRHHAMTLLEAGPTRRPASGTTGRHRAQQRVGRGPSPPAACPVGRRFGASVSGGPLRPLNCRRATRKEK